MTGGNVVPLKRRREPLAYAPGVPAFNRSDPAHVQLWNSMILLALKHQ